MSKITLTGASGFLGRNLLKKLSEHEVIQVYKNNKIEEGWYCDLSKKDSVQMLIERSNPEIIIHCAADAAAKHPENYKEFLENHIISTVNLLEHCKPKTKFIYISSVLVFGNHFPVMEPTNLYGAAKLACEGFCEVYGKLKNLSINIIRPCAIVGQDMTHGLLFDVKRKLKSEDEKIEVWGKEPGSTKPFVHVDDVCDWVLKCINSNVTLPINCFPRDSISVKQVVEIGMSTLNIQKEIIWDASKVWAGDNNVIDTSNQQVLFIQNSSIDAVRRCFNET
jgi:nucleoside-diphosphate-sugar epimerase